MTIDQITKLFLAHYIVRRVTNASMKKAGYAWKYEHFVFLAAIPTDNGVPLKNITTGLFGGEQSTVRRILTDLEKAKLIQIKRETEDRRQRRIHLTTAGLELFEALHGLALDSTHAMLVQDEEEAVEDASGMLGHLQTKKNSWCRMVA